VNGDHGHVHRRIARDQRDAADRCPAGPSDRLPGRHPDPVAGRAIAIPSKDGDAVPESAPLTLRVDVDHSVSFDDGPRFPGRELATRLRGQLPRVRAVFVDAGDAVPWAASPATSAATA
jgi:hypothetical protein